MISGSEMLNDIIGNFVIGNQQDLNHDILDQQPAGILISNPNNYFFNNFVSGVKGAGF